MYKNAPNLRATAPASAKNSAPCLAGILKFLEFCERHGSEILKF
nr:hypothetical protein [uncultured Campylobacter sp.]